MTFNNVSHVTCMLHLKYLCLMLLCLPAYASTLDDLSAYGEFIVGLFPSDALQRGTVSRTGDSRLTTYTVPFISADESLLALPGTERDQAIFEANRKRTAKWHRVFCQLRLQQMMKRARIGMVRGTVADEAGNRELVSLCFAK